MAQPAAHAQSAFARKHDVEQDQIVDPAARVFETRRPVGCHIDGVPLPPEVVCHRSEQARVVLDDQDSHNVVTSVPGAAPATMPARSYKRGRPKRKIRRLNAQNAW